MLLGLKKAFALFLRHWSTRLALRLYNYAPFLYVAFLEYAADYLILRRAGGGYLFIHRVVTEYFASLEPHPTD